MSGAWLRSAVVARPAVLLAPNNQAHRSALTMNAFNKGVPISETPITPMVAASKHGRTWRQAKMHHGQVNISGGFCAKPVEADCQVVQMDGKTHRFIKLDKNTAWFLQGVGGNYTRKGDLKAVSVIQELREGYADGSTPAGPAAVAEGDDGDHDADDDDDGDVDPMDALDAVVDNGPKCKRQKVRSEIKTLKMPLHPPCAGSHETTDVLVYSQSQKMNRPFFICADSIDWLLAYAADELALQGVKADTPADAAKAGENCPEVAGLHLEWNFTKKAWHAEFVTGPFKGVARSFGTADLTLSLIHI